MLEQFERTELLLGKEKLERLAKARVAIFGVGGVGGYVVEALVIEDDGGLTALIYPDFQQGAKDGMAQSEFIKYIKDQLSEWNKELPNYAKLKKIEVMSEDFERTPKKSIKRYLYQRH